MKPDLSAKQYAMALWSVTEKMKVTDEVKNSLQYLCEMIKTESVFRSFIHTVRIKTTDKIKILKELFSDQIPVIVLEIIALLDENKQVSLLAKISDDYSKIYQEKSNTVPVTVSTHAKLDEDEISSICNLLEKVTGKTVVYTSKTEPSMLGGIKLRIGNTMIDGSLAVQVEKLRRSLVQ